MYHTGVNVHKLKLDLPSEDGIIIRPEELSLCKCTAHCQI